MKIATAKGKEVGRGQTVHAVHCSEVAFYPDPESLMLSLKQAVPDLPGTIVILESTANGAGNWFHQEWFAAKAGESDFIPLFFPWFMHDEYSFRDTTLTYDRPDQGRAGDDARSSTASGSRNWHGGGGASATSAATTSPKFQQEYPNDDHEAFLTTGRNIFPQDTPGRVLRRPSRELEGFISPIRDPLEPQGTFHKDGTGELTIFKYPHPGQKLRGAPATRPAPRGGTRPVSRCSTATPSSRWPCGTATASRWPSPTA